MNYAFSYSSFYLYAKKYARSENRDNFVLLGTILTKKCSTGSQNAKNANKVIRKGAKQ